MKKLKFPFPFGKVYFVGIGGIGMSGIAEIMHLSGYNVSGSAEMTRSKCSSRRTALSSAWSLKDQVISCGSARSIAKTCRDPLL